VTQHDQYQAHPPAQQPYQQQGPGYPQPGFQPQRTNTMAILGLVFAFVFTPLGLVFSAIGLKQVKERRENGRGLALAGLILSIVFILLGVLLVVLLLTVLKPAVEAAAQAEQAVTAPAEEVSGTDAAAEDPTGVVAACDVIVPASLNLENDLVGVTAPEDYAQVMTALGSAMEAAAAGTTDPSFVAHVQQLSADLQLAGDTVMNGEDPSFLEETLNADGAAIDSDCAAAGWTE
jgi:hypothetical protein